MLLSNIFSSNKNSPIDTEYKIQHYTLPSGGSGIKIEEAYSVREIANTIFYNFLIPCSKLALVGFAFSYTPITFSAENCLTAFITAVLAAKCLHFSFPRYSPFLWIFNYPLFDPKKTTIDDFKKKLPSNFSNIFGSMTGKDWISFENRSPSEQRNWSWKKIQNFFKKLELYSQKYGLKTPTIALKAGGFGGIAGAMTGIGSSAVLVSGTNPVFFTNGNKLDAIICHELSHIKHKDSLPLMTSELLTWSTYLIALKTFSVTLPFFAICAATNRLSTFIASISFKGCEKRADLDAVKILDSARGLISFFKEYQISTANRLETLENGTLWQKAKRKIFYDAAGNVRLDVHPPLSERIRYLKEWEENRISALPFYRRFFARAQNCFRAN